jgi:hypothetical protein
MDKNVDLVNRLDNLIFPLGKGTLNENGDCIDFKLFGTAFLIGTENFALTASHVIQNILAAKQNNEHIVGIFKDSQNRKYTCCIDEQDSIPTYERHPDQDITILKLTIDSNIKIRPPFIIEKDFKVQAADYYSVGYPEHLIFDNDLRPKRPDGTSIPDELNVLTKGYVRRIVKYQLPKLMGNNFLELSEIGTSGYSGAPIVSIYATMLQFSKDNKLQKEVMCHRLLGIYLGEAETELDSEARKIYRGYALNVEVFADWKPKILDGKNISEAMMILIEV